MKHVGIGFSQIIANRILRFLMLFLGNLTLNGTIPQNDTKRRYLFVSNHQSKIDAFAIFGAMPLSANLMFAPMKFMTAHSIYYSYLRPFLASWGCYPHKIPGIDIIDYSASLMRQGYNLFIFPEGKRVTKDGSQPKSGVTRLIEATREEKPVIMLVHIQWKRHGFRRSASVTIRKAPKNLDVSSPVAIMAAIYEL